MELNIFFLFIPLMLLSLLEALCASGRGRMMIYFLSSLIFFIFIALGYKIGVDWVEYSRTYLGSSGNIFEYEIGYTKLNELFAYAGVSFWVYYFIVKVSYVISVCVFFGKFSKLPTCSLLLFVGFMFPYFNDPLRQLIATTGFLCVFIFFKRCVGLIGIIFLSLFHSSFMLMVVSFIHKLGQKHTLVLMAIMTVLFVVVFNAVTYYTGSAIYPFDIILDKLRFYINSAQNANVISMSIRVLLLMYVCFYSSVMYCNTVVLGSRLTHIFWVLSLCYLTLEVSFFMVPLIPQRMRFYFIPFVLVLISNRVFFFKYVTNKLVIILIFSMYLSGSLYMFISKPIGTFYMLDRNLIIKMFDTEYSDVDEISVDEFWRNGN